MTRHNPHISDHAVLRYLERVHGVDVAAVRRQIAREVGGPWHASAPSSVVSGGIAYRLAYRDGVTIVVTVVPRKARR